MSAKAPQVLSRRANGGPQTSSNQTSEPTKVISDVREQGT